MHSPLEKDGIAFLSKGPVVRILSKAILLCILLLQAAGADQSFFDKRLTLPSLPNFERLAVNPSYKPPKNATPDKSYLRWSIAPQEPKLATRYLLAHKSQPLWVSISLHHSQYGPNRSLKAQDFSNQLKAYTKKLGLTVEQSKEVETKGLGTIGSLLLTSEKTKGYTTNLLYIPALKEGSYPGDNFAFTIAVTYNSKTAAEASKMIQSIISTGKVGKKS